MDLNDIIRVLQRGFWLLVVATVLGVGGGVLATIVATPTYQASARLFLSVQTGETSAAGIAQGSSAAAAKVESYAAVVTSQPVLGPVVEHLGLDETPGALASAITVTAGSSPALMDIKATDTDPARAARVVNAVVDQFDAVVADLEQPLPDGSSPVKITTLREATAPTAAVEPRPAFNIGLGGVVGLALGVGVLFLRAMLDTRLRTVQDVASAAHGLPIIGMLGHNAANDTAPLVVRDDPRSPLSEAFRDFRTNLTYASTGDVRTVTMITSALQGEGKTTTAANLALALVENGASVLVIDADLRRPRLAEVFGLESAAGLSDVLVGRAEPDDVIQPWGAGGLHVLPAGRIPPNPSELLGSETMRMLVEDFEQRFDIVIIDAPPLLPVTDASVLSALCGGVVVVAAARRSRRQHLRAALDRLERIEARAVGLAVTMIPVRRGKMFSVGGYGYGYGGYEPRPDAPRLVVEPARRSRRARTATRT